jgi:hypothetical protein
MWMNKIILQNKGTTSGPKQLFLIYTNCTLKWGTSEIRTLLACPMGALYFMGSAEAYMRIWQMKLSPNPRWVIV